MPYLSPHQSRTLDSHTPLFPIGLGAMPLSLNGRPPEKEAIEIILHFFESGGNFVDTADVYGLDDHERGHNEKLIAKTLRQYGKNENILIASKGGASRPQGGWGLGGGKPKMLRQACEQSLKNLEIETHALYYLHGPDKEVPLADSLGELIKLKEEGKIQQLGIANVNLSQLQMAQRLTAIVAVQNRCNLFCKGDLRNGLIDYCLSQGLLYVPYCPLGGWANHQTLAKHKELQRIAPGYQVSTYVLCLAWLLQKGRHILAIPGMDKKEQVAINFSATELILDQQDLDALEQFPDLYPPKHIDP